MNSKLVVTCRGKAYGIPDNKSFFHVARIAESIADRMLEAFIDENYDSSNAFRDAYLQFLSLCGWTEEQYDTELLAGLDRGWR